MKSLVISYWLLVIGVLVAPSEAFAQAAAPGGWFEGIDPACFWQGNCVMEDLIQFIVTLINWLLGVSGSVALFFFAYGGYNWVSSGGNQERITHGKESIKAALIGLFIVFMAWVGVRWVLTDWLGLQVTDGLRIKIEKTISAGPEPGDGSGGGGGGGIPWSKGACYYMTLEADGGRKQKCFDGATLETCLNKEVATGLPARFAKGEKCPPQLVEVPPLPGGLGACCLYSTEVDRHFARCEQKLKKECEDVVRAGLFGDQKFYEGSRCADIRCPKIK